MDKPKTIVIGSGLAGLSAGLELSSRGFDVLLLEASPYIGGRTASWNQNGMEVESGLHRVLGFYTAFPELVKKAGLKMKEVVIWEDGMEVRSAGGPSFVSGASLLSGPTKPWQGRFRTTPIS